MAEKHVVTCPTCGTDLPASFMNSGQTEHCPGCQTATRLTVFPALFAAPKVVVTAPVIADDASCFFHEHKRAEEVCSSCGRFCCSLCTFKVGTDTLCPDCIRNRRDKQDISMQGKLLKYDFLALMLALIPIVFAYPMIVYAPITAAAALYLRIRYRNKPTSILPKKRKWMFFLATVLSALELIAFLVLIIAFVVAIMREII